jgi:HEPN domain-containing protein
MSASRTQFAWPDGNPTNEAEFNRLMWALDKHLAEKMGPPLHRLMGFSIEDALREAGLDWGNSETWRSASVDEPGYTGEPLVAKAFQWYMQIYGGKVLRRNVIADMWSVGFFPASLGNKAVWKVRIPVIWGWPQFIWDVENFKRSGGDSHVGHDAKTVNVLDLTENLSLRLMDYASEREQADLTALCGTALRAARWLRDADKTLSVAKTVAEENRALFWHARQDYVSSTANLLYYNFSQSRWSSSQAIEKTMKGMLEVAGKKYPKNGKVGHDLYKLAQIMETEINVAPREDCVKIGMWPAEARYDDTTTTLKECLQANHAVLKIAEQFSEDETMERLLENVRARKESAVPKEAE